MLISTCSLVEVIVLACFTILIIRTEPGVRYFSLVLVTAVSTVAYPVLWPRRVQSVRGTAGAALAIGGLSLIVSVLANTAVDEYVAGTMM